MESTASSVPQFMTPNEVARMFGVDPRTVTRWAGEGKLTFIRTPGGHRRYFREQVLSLAVASPQPDDVS